MANYLVSYDLNGSTPTHAQMDAHIAARTDWSRGRVLETVWYIGANYDAEAVYDYFNRVLSDNDRLLVVQATFATFRNLLVTGPSLQSSWSSHQ